MLCALEGRCDRQRILDRPQIMHTGDIRAGNAERRGAPPVAMSRVSKGNILPSSSVICRCVWIERCGRDAKMQAYTMLRRI